MASNPWDKFFWNDWENDPGLRLCSFAAQGLWMRVLCICAKADPKGYLVVAGRPLSTPELASLFGKGQQEVETLLRELATNGVYSTDRSGRIFNRRMTNDVKKSRIASENGKKGGNPSLSKDRGNFASDNPKPKGRVKPQEPEATNHKPEQRSRAGLDEIEKQLRSAANLETDSAPGLMDLSPVLGLLDAGYSLEEDVLPIVRSRTKTGNKPRSWSFFTAAITDARARRLQIASAPAPTVAEITEDDWDDAVRRFKLGGLWPAFIKGRRCGPEPGYDGCRAPKDILKRYGYQEAA